MNEELKIIITAMTAQAVKGIKDIKKELEGVSGSAKGASKGIGAAMKGIGAAAVVAVKAIGQVIAAVVLLGKKSLEFQRAQAKLNTAFLSMGSSAKQAAESYKELYRFLGDTDKSVEAAAHLAKLTTNQKELAEWTKICQGVYATFGDSLSIEGLTEAANETARVGKVTGTLADALNWAGVSEDEFNAKLARTASYSEREALIRETLNGLYNDAAEIYEKNNKALLEYNESQARLNESMGAAGAAVTPLLTALNNLGAVLFDALKPALDIIIPALATFVEWVTKGVQAVMAFFGVVTGKKTSVNTFAEIGKGVNNAASGADNLTGGLEDATKEAEKLKRSVMGFDELNIVPSGSSSSNSGSGGANGSNEPAYMTPIVDASKFTMDVEETETEASGFVKLMKNIAEELADIFAPSITAWTTGFETIRQAWNNSKGDWLAGATSIKNAFAELGSYILGTFIPDIVNSFSTNFAPTITDIFAFILEDGGKTFKMLGGLIEDATSNIIIPALELVKGIITDIFDGWGKAWEQHGKPLLEELGKSFEHVRKTVSDLYEQYLKPIITKLIEVVTKAWEESIGPAVDKAIEAVLEIGTCLLKLYNEFVAPIIDWIVANILPIVKNVIDNIIELVGKLLTHIGQIISGVVDVLRGIVKFITGVFTGDWELAWEGVKDLFQGIWDVICGIAKAAWDIIKFIFDWEAIKEFFVGVWDAIKSAFTGIGEWFSNTFTGAKESSTEAWAEIGDWFADRWQDIKDAFGEVGTWFSENFSAAWEDIKAVWSVIGQWFSDRWQDIKKAFEPVDNWFKEKFTAAWNGIKSAWNGVTKWFSDIWTGIKNAFNNTVDWFKTLFENAYKAITDAWKNTKKYFSDKWNEVKDSFKETKDWFKEKFESAYKATTDAWANTKKYFSDKWSDIKTAFSPAKDWFKEKFDGAYTSTKNAFKTAKADFTAVWNNIKNAFGNIPEWFRTKFHEAWTKVKEVFSTGGKVFDGIKDGILNGLKTVINALINGINKIIAVPFNGINSALRTIRNTSIAGIQPFSWLPTISIPQIPKLAKGGIIDRATLAMIGERGKEAVVPLENNTEWIDKLVDKLATRQGGPEKIVLMLDSKELGWASIKSINNITRQTGTLQLTLA